VKRLIVNADDYGRSAGVNAGTLRAHAEGIVTSATVMIREEAAARGVREASEAATGLSLGLHFVLTGGGTPASPAPAVPALAPEGRFRRTREDLPETIPEEEIRAELEAQIRAFEALARRPPTHLDSHHHVALHRSVAPVFAAVARERDLPARASSGEARRMLRAARVRTPDHFIDRFYGENARAGVLREILSGLPDGTSELMCHPGFADETLRRTSTYAEPREREVAVLCDAGIRRLVLDQGIALVGFDAL
jgi:predicted glycoside hydrolase/deacetylase ChbG (UPF0249 family)